MARTSQPKRSSSKPKAKAGQRPLDDYTRPKKPKATPRYQTRTDYKQSRDASPGDTWVRGHYRRDWGTVSGRDYHSTPTYRRYKAYTDKKGHVRNSGKRN